MKVVAAQLFRQNILCRLRTDVPFGSQYAVIIVIVQRQRLGADLIGFHRQTDFFRDFLQEIIIRIFGAFFQFEDDIFFMAVNQFFKIPGRMNFFNQISNYVAAGHAFIARIGSKYLLPVLVFPFQGKHSALLVIFQFDLRIDTQQQHACRFQRFFRRRCRCLYRFLPACVTRRALSR